MTVSRDDIRNAYRFILGRAPEDEHVVDFHGRSHDSVKDLRLALLSSDEFRDQGFLPPPKAYAANEAPREIEVDVDPPTLSAIIAKTAEYWSAIGETAPHWSVLTDERYMPSHISENEAAFYDSGGGDRDLIVSLLRRIGRSAAEFRCCVEYGCGVGRVTAPLAKVFSKVIALDISRPHLDLARKHIQSSGASNVEFLQVTPNNVMPAIGYDLWFSCLVLQHNAPPVTKAILEKAFAGLPRNGVAIIHIPTYRDSYSFKASDYLAGELGQEIEMHFMPQRTILELGLRHNCGLKEIHEEPGHRNTITNIFVFQKM